MQAQSLFSLLRGPLRSSAVLRAENQPLYPAGVRGGTASLARVHGIQTRGPGSQTRSGSIMAFALGLRDRPGRPRHSPVRLGSLKIIRRHRRCMPHIRCFIAEDGGGPPRAAEVVRLRSPGAARPRHQSPGEIRFGNSDGISLILSGFCTQFARQGGCFRRCPMRDHRYRRPQHTKCGLSQPGLPYPRDCPSSISTDPPAASSTA